MAKTAKPSERKQITDPTGYMPPGKLLNRIIERQTTPSGMPTVTMSAEAFNKLLTAALSAGFSETAYLEQHQDVKRKVDDKSVASGLTHFVTHGFFEGRSGFEIEVDTAWYLKTYPDVAQAIKDKQVSDARDHFMLFGYAEGRNPGPAFQRATAEWNQLARDEQK